MTDFDVEAVFQRMHTACEVKNDYQLSKYLGVKASTVKGWKDAKHPPFKACFEIFEKTGVTVEWLLTGIEPAVSRTEQATSLKSYSSIPDLKQFIDMYQRSIETGLVTGFIELNPNITRDEIAIMARQLYASLIRDEIIPKGRNQEAVNA